jgi:hypothetical protein
MAKTTKTGLGDDLNAEGTADDGLNIDELNAGGSVQETQQHDENTANHQMMRIPLKMKGRR